MKNSHLVELIFAISSIGSLISILLATYYSIWFTILLLYFVLHMAFGPLDWGLIYRLLLKLKKVKNRYE